MRKTLLLLALFVLTLAHASDEKEKSVKPSREVSTYVVGILTAGPTIIQDSLAKAEMLESHVDYLKKLNQEGKLYASGALSSDPASRGLYIFNVSSIREAKALMSKDESVSSGWVSLNYHVWKTRDYDAPQPVTMEAASDEDIGSKITAQVILVVVFVLIIITLMLRTFRMKASV